MATLDAFTSKYIGNELKDLQFQNMWVLNFEDYPNFDLYIKDSNLPLFSLDHEKTDFDLILPKGAENLESFGITFYETIDFQGLGYHLSWLKNLYDFDKRVVKSGYHSYKRRATIKFISIYNDYIVSLGQIQQAVNSIKKNGKSVYKIMQNASFDLVGIQCLGVDGVSLDNDSSEPLTFTAKYEVQRIIPDLTRKEL